MSAEREESHDAATESEAPLFCHRCGAELTPGAGDFYVINIEAYADPSPPNLDAMDAPHDLEAEIEDLVRQASESSEQSLMDQVHRRLTIHLCWPCYKPWIENPADPE